jgi:hypothetical protein
MEKWVVISNLYHYNICMNFERIYIGKSAKLIGLTSRTLRNWDGSGKLRAMRDGVGQRYYTLEQLQPYLVAIDAIGWLWATRAQAPIVSNDYYCERQDRFTSRLAKLGTVLSQDEPTIERSVGLPSLLILVAGEIGDNSFAHNVGQWPNVPGVFFAYDLERRQIVLADRGQGVLATLSRVRPSLQDHRSALKVAFTEIVSGRDPEKRGNGLKVVRRVTQTNPITLTFQSGNAHLRLPKAGGVRLRIGIAPTAVAGMFAVLSW